MSAPDGRFQKYTFCFQMLWNWSFIWQLALSGTTSIKGINWAGLTAKQCLRGACVHSRFWTLENFSRVWSSHRGYSRDQLHFRRGRYALQLLMCFWPLPEKVSKSDICQWKLANPHLNHNWPILTTFHTIDRVSLTLGTKCTWNSLVQL